MKILNIIFRVLLVLLCVSPVLGALGIFPAPTPDLYTTAEAYAFIMALYDTGYMNYLLAIVFAAVLALTLMNRMALAALLLLPLMINIVSFHAFLDGGLFSMGAIMADMLLVINVYFLWQNRTRYRALWAK